MTVFLRLIGAIDCGFGALFLFLFSLIALKGPGPGEAPWMLFLSLFLIIKGICLLRPNRIGIVFLSISFAFFGYWLCQFIGELSTSGLGMRDTGRWRELHNFFAILIGVGSLMMLGVGTVFNLVGAVWSVREVKSLKWI